MITKKYYKLIRVSYADEGYFCLTNVSNSIGNVKIDNHSGSSGTVNYEYSTDGVTWNAYSARTYVQVDPNSNIYWRYAGSGNTISIYGFKFYFDFDCYASGNLMSLFSKTDFATYTGSWSATNLFSGQTHLLRADFNFGSQTSINETNQMLSTFYNCSNLVSIPDFSGFTSIGNNVAQALNNTFYGCEKIVVGADFSNITEWISDTGIMNNIYYNCSALRTVYLPDIEDFGSYRLYSWSNGMPTGVNGVIYKNANATISGVPAGWTTQNY